MNISSTVDEWIIYLYNILLLLLYNKNDLIWCPWDLKYTRETNRPLGSLLRKKYTSNNDITIYSII